jgi:integrase
MKRHLAEFPAEGEGLVFRGPLVPRCVATTSSIGSLVTEGCAGGSSGRIPLHDLRHTGNNLAAASGASTRELMHRMGHGTMRAALIYQHATGERDREIADALQFRIERELKEMGPIEGPRLAVDGSS